MSRIETNTDVLRTALAAARIVPVVVIDDPADAVPLARALVAGGLTAIEVTLRTPAALEALGTISAAIPELFVGAGTLLRPSQFAEVAAAGARFAVSPGATPDLLDAAAETALPLLPGAATASEIMILLRRGYGLMKFFPAEAAGGVAALNALAAPLPEARFVPTGGVGPQNARDYLGCKNVIAIGGSWMAPPELIRAKAWDRVEALARKALAEL